MVQISGGKLVKTWTITPEPSTRGAVRFDDGRGRVIK